jgi:uncharacterized protein (TIGR02118 family)
MVSYFVRYRGSSPDPAGFQHYYETRHAEILRRFSSIRSLALHRPIAWSDPFPVRPGGTLLLAQMMFDSEADLHAALQSPARREARDDLHRFPVFEGEVTHDAMRRKLIF